MSLSLRLFALCVVSSYLVAALPVLTSLNASLVRRQRGSGRQSGTQRGSGRQGGNNRQGNTASGTATNVATDGSQILEDEVVINGLNLRFKVSAPEEEFIVNGATGAATLGINVLFHGDGGQSFVDFPNQGVNSGLMGVALLAPDDDFRWGGSDPQDQTGLVRPDGEAHSAAVNEFITNVLPTIVSFDTNQIFLEGISGGALMLSGFTIPEFGASLNVQGAILGCGGLEPQVQVQGDISALRLHFQSTSDELAALQVSIPQAVTAYTDLVTDLTDDASPQGGHCEFDEQGFVSGVQLLTDNFANILNGVANAVVGAATTGAATGGNRATQQASTRGRQRE